MKKAVATFGRLNPPTNGHEKLAKAVERTAKTFKAKPFLFLSQSQDLKKNPLSFSDKYQFASKAFGRIVSNKKVLNYIDMLKKLDDMGFTDVVIIVGSDRIPEVKRLADRYNGSEYKFNTIEIRSAGDRDPDAEGVSGISASKMRAAAAENDFETFAKGAPRGLSKADVEKMFTVTRKKMNIKEEREIRDLVSILEDIEIGEHEGNIFLEFNEPEDIDNVVEDDYVINMFPEEEDLEERKALSIAQRRQIGRRFKRLAPRIARIRKIKAKRMANRETLMKRARKAAISLLRKRVAGKKGENYKSLPVSSRVQIDKAIEKQRGKVDRIAQRLLPKIMKKERERLASLRAPKKESTEEGKNHSWKTDGHYKKDGTEWKGDQHAYDGQVMTGKKHTKDSENLYHFKDLSQKVRQMVLDKLKIGAQTNEKL